MRHEREHPPAAAAARTDGRRSDRRGIRKHAILHCHDRVQTVLIRDISPGGMKIQNAFGLVAGDPVRLELLTRRALDGVVAWSVPPYCGIQFDMALADDDPLLMMITPRGTHG